MKFDLGSVSITKRKRLPHWRAQHSIYFITYNLYDAVPAQIKASLVEQAAAQFANIRRMRGDVTIAERNAIEEWLKAKIGETLDFGYGECFMSSPDVAALVSASLRYFDQERYELLSWSVMPNHVHVVMFPYEPVDRILHSWKSFTRNAQIRFCSAQARSGRMITTTPASATPGTSTTRSSTSRITRQRRDSKTGLLSASIQTG